MYAKTVWILIRIEKWLEKNEKLLKTENHLR